ncbi:hypothetical protein QQ020_35825 [Fulvivirgaceae bacterium BMA12]|uniref:Lipoprotein n=1 Tax=Agaribacillus aureus TaxID=3051825 RepID=A0ABT8LI92_9BACT|nr:hypothetical protein [Fulvivirgaceae bacterium BMA12]
MNYQMVKHTLKLFVILLIVSCTNTSDHTSNFDPHIKDFMVESDKKEIIGHFRLVIWGISGNHRKIILSENKKSNTKYDSLTDYIFSDVPVFYKVSGDTLNIYTTGLSRIPKNQYENLIVNQIKISGPEYHKLLDDYKSKGFDLIH